MNTQQRVELSRARSYGVRKAPGGVVITVHEMDLDSVAHQRQMDYYCARGPVEVRIIRDEEVT